MLPQFKGSAKPLSPLDKRLVKWLGEREKLWAQLLQLLKLTDLAQKSQTPLKSTPVKIFCDRLLGLSSASYFLFASLEEAMEAAVPEFKPYEPFLLNFNKTLDPILHFLNKYPFAEIEGENKTLVEPHKLKEELSTLSVGLVKRQALEDQLLKIYLDFKHPKQGIKRKQKPSPWN